MAVFSYARRLLTDRPPLWWAALACAAILVLPGAVLATLLVRPATMLLLTGDLDLAGELMPASFRGGWRLFAWAGGAVVLGSLFHRTYAVLLWASDEERDAGWRGSWRATERVWVRFLFFNAALMAALIAVCLAVAGSIAAIGSSPGAATLVLLIGGGFVVVLRTVGRIHVTLAARAAILDDQRIREAWRSARGIVRDRRRQVVAAWASLLALGVAVWLGGRLVTPILQDTALDLPRLSSYALAREAAQLAVAIPLEAFVLVLSSAIWTAVYRGIETETAPTPARPWMPRALAALVVLAIIGNGVPAVAEVAWRKHERSRERKIRVDEIVPDRVERARPPSAAGARTSYRVQARLDHDWVRWSTAISYTNGTEGTIRRLPVRVYPAAFAGELEEIPLADEVLSSTIPTTIRERLRAGSFEVRDVSGSRGKLDWELEETILWIDLDEGLRPGSQITFRVNLEASLPAWPLRYGTWDNITQLGNWIPVVPVEKGSGFHLDPYGDIGDPFFSPTADYDVKLEAPEEIGVVGTGELVDVSTVGDRRTWHFVADDVRDAAFAAGVALRGLQRRAAGTVVRVWYNGEDTLIGQDLLDEASAAVDRFSTSYGALEADEVDVVLIESPLGGMEYPGVVFVSTGFTQLEGLPIIPDLVGHAGFVDEQQRYIAGHELAHQWWYAAVGNDQVREPWLDEAFAEASTRLWLRSTDGDETSSMIAHLEAIPEPEAGVIDLGTSDFDTNSAYSDSIYGSGGAVLVALHDLVGRSAYDRLMRAWLDRYEGRIATIDDFEDVTERVAGADARAFLDSYRKR